MAGQDPINVTYTDADGGENTVSGSQIFQQLQQMGYNVQGVSGDGMTYHFNDPRGDYTMTAPDVMKNLGHEVSFVSPSNSDESKLNLGYRLAISRLPDDDAKKAYLESKLKRDGVDQPNIIGHGRDWHYFDSQANGWKALTNSKHWDLNDAAEAGIEGIHALGSGVGAIGGAALGGGAASIPLAAAGAAAGGAVAETGIRGALNYFDPEYRNVTTFKGQAKDVAAGAGIDAALIGAGGVVGKAVRPFLGASEEGVKRLALTGPVSTAAKAIGKTAQSAGGLMDLGGQATKSPFVREGIKMFTPGLSQAQAASMALQAPEYLSVGAAKAARALAPTEAAKQGAEEILTKAAPQSMFDRFNSAMRGAAADAPEIKASNVGRNVGEKLAGMSGASEEGVKTAQRVGQKTGKTFEDLATVGRSIDKGSDALIRGAGAAASGTGKALQIGGKALYNTGSVTQPFEYLGAGSFLGRDQLQPKMRKILLERERKALQEKMNPSKLKNDYAQND